MKPAWVLGALVGAVLLSYGNTISGRFVYDDRAIIAKNPIIRKLDRIPLLFSSSYWGMNTGQPQPYKGTLYRPLTMTTFALNYAAGELDPRGYHAANLVLHLGVTILFWMLCLRLGCSGAAAGAAALLFAVLPVHTEAVSNIVGRSEVLAAFFVLAAWLFVAGLTSRANILLGSLCLTLALLSKENAAIFLPVLILADRATERKSWRDLAKDRLLVWTVFGGVLLLVLEWRSLILGKALSIGAVPYFSTQSWPIVFLTMATFTVQHYLRPLCLGTGLTADYTRPVIPDVSLADPTAWLCVLLLGACIGYAVISLRNQKNLRSLGVLLFFGFLIPASNLIVSLEVIGAERFLYLPSIGYCLALGLLFGDRQHSGRKASYWACGVFAGLCLWYGAKTFERNRVWSSEETLWTATVQGTPMSPRAWNGLGLARMNQGRYDEALEDFKKALTLNSFLSEAFLNMGECYYAKGDFKRANNVFLEMIRIKPYDRDTLFYLGATAEQSHDYPVAAAYYARVLTVNPYDRTAKRNLALLQCKMGNEALCRTQLEAYLRGEGEGEHNDDIRGFLNRAPERIPARLK